MIDVHQLAKGFGFVTAPRVKGGKFLTKKAQLEQKSKKKSK